MLNTTLLIETGIVNPLEWLRRVPAAGARSAFFCATDAGSRRGVAPATPRQHPPRAGRGAWRGWAAPRLLALASRSVVWAFSGAALALAFLLACAPAHADMRLRGKNYRHKWAVVVGANYADRNDARLEGIAELKNAENDAKTLAETLIQSFGFERAHVKLLVGAQATHKNISDLLGKKFLKDPAQVGSDDCVLVFFAGHGDREVHKDFSNAYFYPQDLEVIQGKGVNDASCLRLSNVIEDLKACAARHKLLIVDTCHSGEIFKIARARSGSSNGVDPSLFDKPVFQAMAAARGDQQADDGALGHSAFSQALLQCLSSDIDAAAFGASELFNRVPARVRQDYPRQNPHGGVIDGDGEFYFIRSHPVAPLAPVDAPNPTLHALPGLRGKWWFEETPWLIPTLRLAPEMQSALPREAVLAAKPSPEGALPTPARVGAYAPRPDDVYARLRESAEAYYRKRPAQERGLWARLNQLAADEPPEAAEERQALADSFAPLGDAHLQAVLRHALLLPDAAEHYLQALEEYETRLKGANAEALDARGAYWLCLADYGVYLLHASRYDFAANFLRDARKGAPDMPPPPLFAAWCLLRESEAHVRLGDFAEARETLRLADNIVGEKLPPEHPLRTALLDRAAWNAMDQWRLEEARDHFTKALAARERSPIDDLTDRLARLHERHGLAMTHRFAGRLDEAIKAYRGIVVELKRELRQAESRRLKEAAHARLVNTLERLGDCQLFGSPARCDEAIASFQEAIELCPYQSPMAARKTEVKLRCKLALALTLADEFDDASHELSNATGGMDRLLGDQGAEVALFRGAAEALLESRRGGQAKPLRAFLQEHAGRRGHTRQAIELLLFAAEQLLRPGLDAEAPPAAAPAPGDADVALKAAPNDFVNAENLPFLRPFLDTALALKARHAKPRDLTALARQMVRAKTGDGLFEPPAEESLAVFYLRDRAGWVLLSPRGASDKAALFSLPFGRADLAPETSADGKTADGKTPPVALPAALLEAAKKSGPLVIQWADQGVSPPLANAGYPFAETLPGRLLP